MAQDGSGTIDFDEFLQMMTAKMSEKVRGEGTAALAPMTCASSSFSRVIPTPGLSGGDSKGVPPL